MARVRQFEAQAKYFRYDVVDLEKAMRMLQINLRVGRKNADNE